MELLIGLSMSTSADINTIINCYLFCDESVELRHNLNCEINQIKFKL